MTSETLRFLDTNVLVYAYERSEKQKHPIARQIVADIWRNGGGAVSLQVLSEFYVVVTRKMEKPLDAETSRRIIADILASPSWQIAVTGPSTLLSATRMTADYSVSLWDALIAAAMQESGISTVLTEDAAFAKIPGVRAVNPFLRLKQPE